MSSDSFMHTYLLKLNENPTEKNQTHNRTTSFVFSVIIASSYTIFGNILSFFTTRWRRNTDRGCSLNVNRLVLIDCRM